MTFFSFHSALDIWRSALKPDLTLLISIGLLGLTGLLGSFEPWLGLLGWPVLAFVIPALSLRGEVDMRHLFQSAGHWRVTRRMALVLLLLVILFGTILGTALVALAFMFSALAMIGMSREGIETLPEGLTNAFVFFGPMEWSIAAVLFAGFATLAIWLLARTSMAIPATLHLKSIKVLSVWPLTWHKVSEVISALVLVLAPGLVLILIFQHLLDAGMLRAMLLSALFVGMVLAPLITLLDQLYTRYSIENANRLDPVRTD